MRRDLPFRLPEDIIEEFERYLDDWAAAAEGHEQFHWVGAIDSDDLARFAHYWVNVAQFVANEGAKWGIVPAPVQAQEFYDAAISSLVSALTSAGAEASAFGERLGAVWPAFDRPTSIDLTEDPEDSPTESQARQQR